MCLITEELTSLDSMTDNLSPYSNLAVVVIQHFLGIVMRSGIDVDEPAPTL